LEQRRAEEDGVMSTGEAVVAPTPVRSVPAAPRLGFVGLSAVVFVLLSVASWAFILADPNSGFQELFTGEAWREGAAFLKELLGLGSAATPAYLQMDRWAETAGLAYQTFAMSVLAICLAACGVLLTFLPGARNLVYGELALSRSPLWRAAFFLVRGVYVFTRGVPELLWAMLLVFFFNPGLLPGALALAIHNFGILGKLCAEVVEDTDGRPIRALRATGARGFQIAAYGILPQALPQFLTYALYRWEVIIRTTVVVGFVSAGGLGREFRLHMSWFHYTDVALLLMWYLILVVGVDLISAWLRRLAR
jgi:phosphonate transport system permease protein